MESPNLKLQRSDMEVNMPPRWGFSSFGVGGYKDVAPPELKNRSSVAAPTIALIQRQWRVVNVVQQDAPRQKTIARRVKMGNSVLATERVGEAASWRCSVGG